MAAAAAAEPAFEALHAKYADDSDEELETVSGAEVYTPGPQQAASSTAAAAAGAEQEQQLGNGEVQGAHGDDWYDEYADEDDEDSDDDEIYAALEWADDNEGVRLHGAAGCPAHAVQHQAWCVYRIIQQRLSYIKLVLHSRQRFLAC
jgi:hypothetical protein